MQRRTMLAALLATLAAGGGRAAEAAYKEITWLQLVPKDWNPRAKLGLPDLKGVDDNDPQAKVAMSALREVLDTAPTVSTFDGQRIRMPGYVVPLEQSRAGLKEFLLVPYFGACVHTPPPPANQIVHVVSAQPVREFDTLAAVWVHGTLEVSRDDTALAISGYRLQLARMEPYKGP